MGQRTIVWPRPKSDRHLERHKRRLGTRTIDAIFNQGAEPEVIEPTLFGARVYCAKVHLLIPWLRWDQYAICGPINCAATVCGADQSSRSCLGSDCAS